MKLKSGTPYFLTQGNCNADAEPSFFVITIDQSFRDRVLERMETLSQMDSPSAGFTSYFPCSLAVMNPLKDFYDEENTTDDSVIAEAQKLWDANPHQENLNIEPVEVEGYRLEGDNVLIYSNYIVVKAFIKHTDVELYSGWIMKADLENIKY